MEVTKEQERKALEEIRWIVKGLGEDSYLGKALDGCFDAAEFNLENDCFDSIVEQYETEIEYLRQENARLKAEQNGERVA